MTNSQKMTMSKPVAVLISDVHYSVQNLQLADAAMRMAIDKANELKVPLVVAGDLHDTKANLRGECVNAMVETFKRCASPPYILVGNHDKINEKSENHSLNFLWPFGAIVDYLPTAPVHNIGYLIPYQHDAETLRKHLKTIPKGSQLIMHQGLTGSVSGEYIQDKSAITHADVCDFRVISGHYHTRQDIITTRLGIKTDGMVGVFSYIGNPFTVNYGEVSDPPKGFQILMDDGTLEFVPTNLRKHVIWNEVIGIIADQPPVSPGDLLWIKMYGTREQLAGITRNSIPIKMPFKLDLIPTDTTTTAKHTDKLSNGELLDALIDSMTTTTEARKTRLKDKWKQLCE